MTIGHVRIGDTHVILQVMFTKLALPLGLGYIAEFGFVIEIFFFAICFRREPAEEQGA